MRLPSLIVTVVAGTLLVAPASPQDGGSREDQLDKSVKQTKELQKERIATLNELFKLVDVLFQNQRVSFEEALEARVLLIEAELDAAEKDSDRIAHYQKLVEVLKRSESRAKTLFESTRTSGVPFLKAKARRLQAEVQLERAKAKGVEAETKKTK